MIALHNPFPNDPAADHVLAKMLEGLGLTPREAEVLLGIAQGKGNPDIATILGCRPATVKKHTIHIFEKLGVEGRPAAILRALETLAKRIQ